MSKIARSRAIMSVQGRQYLYVDCTQQDSEWSYIVCEQKNAIYKWNVLSANIIAKENSDMIKVPLKECTKISTLLLEGIKKDYHYDFLKVMHKKYVDMYFTNTPADCMPEPRHYTCQKESRQSHMINGKYYNNLTYKIINTDTGEKYVSGIHASNELKIPCSAVYHILTVGFINKYPDIHLQWIEKEND